MFLAVYSMKSDKFLNPFYVLVPDVAPPECSKSGWVMATTRDFYGDSLYVFTKEDSWTSYKFQFLQNYWQKEGVQLSLGWPLWNGGWSMCSAIQEFLKMFSRHSVRNIIIEFKKINLEIMKIILLKNPTIFKYLWTRSKDWTSNIGRIMEKCKDSKFDPINIWCLLICNWTLV